MTGEPLFDQAADRLTEAVRTLCGYDVDDLAMDLDELAMVWLRLDELRRELGVLVDDFAANVGDKLSDMPYERKDGYLLPNGERIHHVQRSTTRWEGHRLLVDLSTDVVDTTTGERFAAIPTDVLTQIIPGTATDKLTSSTWGVSGLSNVGVDPDDYRQREWKPPRAQKGPGR